MNRKMIRLAFTAWCGGLGAKGPGSVRCFAALSIAFAASYPSMPARARYPQPVPALFKTWRRETPLPMTADSARVHDMHLPSGHHKLDCASVD